MKTTDELFADTHGTASFHDTVHEATGNSVTDEELKEVFLKLPEHIRNIAHAWGLSDTPFRDEAYDELSKPKCCACGTTENLHKDGWYGYRCNSPGCIVF